MKINWGEIWFWAKAFSLEVLPVLVEIAVIMIIAAYLMAWVIGKIRKA